MNPAPPVSPELAAAANCAGAFLLFVLFVLLAILGVALHLGWRGLVTSRRSLPEAMALMLQYVDKVQSGARTTTGAIVEPQVAVSSRLAGLRAGARVLVGRGQPPRPQPGASEVSAQTRGADGKPDVSAQTQGADGKPDVLAAPSDASLAD